MVLLNSINGYIYLKIDKFKEVLNLFNIEFKFINFSFDNAWLSGFFEGDGYVNINRCNYQITLSISQKNKQILNLISDKFNGNLSFDKSLGSYY